MLKFYDNEDCNFSKILKNMSNQGQINSHIHRDTYHSISDVKRWKKTERYLGKNKIILIDRDGVIDAKVIRLANNTNPVRISTAACSDVTEKRDIIIVTSLNYHNAH